MSEHMADGGTRVETWVDIGCVRLTITAPDGHAGEVTLSARSALEAGRMLLSAGLVAMDAAGLASAGARR